jgi:hypothetical protein
MVIGCLVHQTPIVVRCVIPMDPSYCVTLPWYTFADFGGLMARCITVFLTPFLSTFWYFCNCLASKADGRRCDGVNHPA